MLIWTLDRIFALAPDERSKEAARRLAHPPLWKAAAGNEQMVWGDCRGKDGLFYQTAVDLADTAFHCSCGQKRQPCRHALALLLFLHNYPDNFRVTDDMPEWAIRWSAARQKRKAPKEDTPEKQEQRAKNRDKRLDVMAAGMDELDAWLRDLIRQGLAAAESRPPAYWEQIAARMTDAKLGAVARRLRLLAHSNRKHEHILAEVCELFLLVEGFRRLDRLPSGLQIDLLSAAGLAQRKDDLEGLPGVSDVWLVVGVEIGEEEQLRFRRVWFYGQHSGQFALLLDYVWGDAPFPGQWPAGDAFSGEVVFFPSAYLLRALAQPMQPAESFVPGSKGYAALQDAAVAYAVALAANPWLYRMPVILDEMIPGYIRTDFILKDGQGKCIALDASPETGLRLTALGGGHPLSLFGTWAGNSFRPLAAWAEERFVVL